MLPAAIIAQSRIETNTTTSQWSDVVALANLNIVKNDLWSAIVSVIREEFNWQRWTTDLVSGQGEYLIPEVATNLEGAKKLNTVAICMKGQLYTGTSALYYKKAGLRSFTGLPNDWGYYQQAQDPEHPIYVVSDNSIFIAPLPTQNVTNGIALTGIRNIKDYTALTTEAQMIIPLDQQQMLIKGLNEYAYLSKNDPERAMGARSYYITMRDEACRRLANRVESPFENVYPDDQAKMEVPVSITI